MRVFAATLAVAALWITPAEAQKLTGRKASVLPPVVFEDWMSHNEAGWVAVSRGYLDVAEHEFAAAIRKVQPYSSEDPRLLARSYNDLAWVLHRVGRSRDALPLAEWALIAREAHLGPNSEPVGQTLALLGSIEGALGRPHVAEERLTKALAVSVARTGKSSREVAQARLDLAAVQIVRRKFPQARDNLERVLATRTTILSDYETERALAWSGLADIDQAEGRTREAIGDLDRALTIFEKSGEGEVDFLKRLESQRTNLLRIEEEGNRPRSERPPPPPQPKDNAKPPMPIG